MELLSELLCLVTINMLPELTEREIEILTLISQGLTITEIAEKLYLSEHTVITHKRNLFSKLHARNSAHLVTRGYEYGFL